MISNYFHGVIVCSFEKELKKTTNKLGFVSIRNNLIFKRILDHRLTRSAMRERNKLIDNSSRGLIERILGGQKELAAYVRFAGKFIEAIEMNAK